MSIVVQLRPARRAATQPVRIALLGTGTVGRAFAARYLRLRDAGVALPEVAWISNSRVQLPCAEGLAAAVDAARSAPARPGGIPPWAEGERVRRGDIVVDATASERVADWHPEWLARGVHVVTANKLGNGGDLGRSQAIAEGQREGARYGDSATVGAGLPLLRTLRALVAGGDRIHAVEGVLSGTLAWLFSRYDGTQPFSALVREARDLGYAEPDPREDLSGQDVLRKLLILARAAGLPLEAHQVEVEPMLPAALRDAPTGDADALLSLLDPPIRVRWQQAAATQARLCFVGRFDGEGRANAALRALPATHPLCAGSGTDNRVAIWSDRYREAPLVIQGPGAGAGITAAALLDDVLAIA